MRRPGVAVRRFYRAFYSWSLLNPSLDTSTITTGRCICATDSAAGHGTGAGRTRRVFHSNGPSRLRIYRYPSAEPLEKRPARSIELESAANTPRDDHCGWSHAPVESAAQRPFASLQPGNFIVRYRSEYGLMLEYAVERERLQALQDHFGKKLEKATDDSGPRIEVEALTAAVPSTDQHIVSVLLSGTFDEVDTAYKALRQYEPGWTPRHTVFSPAGRPSSAMLPLDFVVREKSSSNMVVELSITEPQFMRFVASNDITSTAEAFKVAITIGEPEQRPCDASSVPMALARSLMISGSPDHVIEAKSDIVSHLRSNYDNPKPLMETPSASPPTSHQAPHSDVRYSVTLKLPYRLSDLSYYRQRLQKLGVTLGPSHTKSHQLHVVGTERDIKMAKTFLQRQTEKICRGKALPVHGIQEIERRQNEEPTVKDTPSDTPLRDGVRKLVREKYEPRKFGPHKVMDMASGHPGSQAALKSSTTTGNTLEGDLIHQFFSVQGPLADPIMDRLHAKGNMQIADIYKSSGVHSLCVTDKDGLMGVKIIGTANTVANARKQIRARMLEVCKRNSWELPNEVIQNIPMKSPAALKESVRTAMRSLTHPVVLVTAATGEERDPENYLRNCRGVTVSSFTAVTLTPQPIISFNLKVPSRTWDAILASRQMRIHLLSATPRGAAIADIFTRPYEQPHEGFQKLQDIGVGTFSAWEDKPPSVRDTNKGRGILRNLYANLLLDKCVMVGDHVIVVSQVRDHKMLYNDHMSLAYTMGGYRGADGALVPKARGDAETGPNADEAPASSAIMDDPDAAPLDAENPLGLGEWHTQMNAVNESQPLQNDRPHDEAVSTQLDQDRVKSQLDYPEPPNDPLYDALRSTRDATDEEIETDLYKHMTEWDGSEDIEAPSIKGEVQREDGPLSGSGSVLQTPRRTETSNRPYSTFSRPPFANRRLYSTTASRAEKDVNGIVHPSTLQTTVSDYLNIPDNARPITHRVRNVWRRKQEAAIARDQLAAAAAGTEPLSEEEITQLNHEASTNERIVAKKLAWNATLDLRVMLDKGRYDAWFFGRVAFLEGCVERGQAVLLEEAKILRTMFEEGKVDMARFEMIKEKLNSDYEMMVTETNRLRQVVEEEGDGAWKFDDD